MANVSLTRSMSLVVFVAILFAKSNAECNSVPKSIKNASSLTKYISFSYKTGEKYVYYCDNFFYTIDPNTTVCQENGKWSLDDNLPSCIRSKCPPPPTIERGSYFPKKNIYNGDEIVTYSCDKSYAIRDLKVSTCKIKGSEFFWDPKTLPVCVSVCPNPDPVVNAEMFGDTAPYFPGEKVSYKCKDKLRFKQPEFEVTSTCHSDRRWTKSRVLDNLPICYCSEPPTILNGKHYPETMVLPGQMIQFSCDKDYLLNGTKELACQDDGDWPVAKFPKCEPLPGTKPPEPFILKCYNCNSKENPFCYYAADTRHIAKEDCLDKESNVSYCASIFTLENGSVSEVKRGCGKSLLIPNKDECLPSDWKPGIVTCKYKCTTMNCNLISANDLFPCTNCNGHGYCDHIRGKCVCDQGYVGEKCLRRNQTAEIIIRRIVNNVTSEKRSRMEARKNNGCRKSSCVGLIAFSFGLIFLHHNYLQ